MTIYSIAAPDGKTYEIEGPAGATQEQVQSEVIKQNPHLGTSPTVASQAAPVPAPAISPVDSRTPWDKASKGDIVAGLELTRGLVGAASPVIGALQAGANVGDWISKKMGSDPVLGKYLAEKVGEYEAAKQRGMAAMGKEGTDYIGTLGGLATGAGALRGVTPAASYLGKVAQGATVGGVAGATTPSSTPGIEQVGQQAATGALLGGMAPIITSGVAKVAGKLLDLRNPVAQKASAISREALGDDLPVILNALREAPPGVTAAQATAHINSPAWQALVERSLKGDRDAVRAVAAIKQAQTSEATNSLAVLAGGDTQTAAKQAQIASRNALRDEQIPKLNIELDAANTAGKLKPALEGEAQRMTDAAASKVQDVRRFTEVQPRAETAARAGLTARGFFGAPIKYTYMGELGKKAEEVAQQAANASLDFGQAAVFKQAAADSLAAHGLRPLEIAPVVNRIKAIANNPQYAGNDIVAATTKQLAADMEQWSKNGVIDAHALDALRVNSVNATVQKLYPTLEATAQKRLASKVISEVKPAIIDAIEKAGGTGYKDYLEAYSKGSQVVAQQKLSAQALHLYETAPDKFVQLVKGNSPKEVEKIFGPGSFDIAKEMSENAMTTLRKVSEGITTDKLAAKQAAEGMEALRGQLMASMSKIRIPSYLSAVTTTTNKALDLIEARLGKATMKRLGTAMQSGKSAVELLSTMPAADRNAVIKAFSSPAVWPGAPKEAVIAVAANQLAPQNQTTNALAQ